MIAIDMEMPESCETCPCWDSEYAVCFITGHATPDDDDGWGIHCPGSDDCPFEEVGEVQKDKYVAGHRYPSEIDVRFGNGVVVTYLCEGVKE